MYGSFVDIRKIAQTAVDIFKHQLAINSMQIVLHYKALSNLTFENLSFLPAESALIDLLLLSECEALVSCSVLQCVAVCCSVL